MKKTTIRHDASQYARLRRLSKRTKVPIAEYIRLAVDLILEKYK